MKRSIFHRISIIMLVLILITVSLPLGTSTSYAEENNITLFHDNFEEMGSSAWTPVSGTWNTVYSNNEVLFSDDFENESAAQWNQNSGIWSIVQNSDSLTYQQSSNEGASEIVAGNASWTDYSFETDVKLIGGAGAMINFRYQDNQHFYYLYMSETYIRLMKQNGSNQDWLTAYDGTSLDTSKFVHIKIELLGNQIKIYRDGELVISTTDDNNYFSTGKIGLATWNTTVEYDNVSVTNTSSNQVYAQSDGNGGESYAGNNSWSDYSVQAQVKPEAINEDATLGLSLRYQDSDNRYIMQYNANGTVQIIKVEEGVSTPLAEAPYHMDKGTSYVLKGVAGGQYLDFYINGNKLLSTKDSSFINGKISLQLSKATASYDNITVLKVVAPIISDGNTVYYISSSTGDDENDGLSEATAWRTLHKINESTFEAGDEILLKSGDTWKEPLILKGSGSEDLPITITSYGSGDKPVITWNAPSGGSVITGHNLSNWVIKGLAVHIIPSSTLSWSNITAGIVILYDDNTQLHQNVVIDENEVYSTSYNSNTNGIVISSLIPGTGIKEVAREITISNNNVHDVGWYGITSTGWDTAKNEELRSQVLYGNIKVSSNQVYNLASQGIVVQNAHNSVIQRNVVHDGGLGNDTWGPGGLWFIASRDSVIKFNEIYNMRDANSGFDGAGLNIDWYCDNITVQYNYSHDNKGNGITTMSNYGSKILNNKVSGNQAQQSNGRGQIALGNFTGRPDLSTGLHDVEVANNTIIVDVDHTVAINTASNPYGTWTGNSIHDNNIVIKEGLTNTDVFSIAQNTSIDLINKNTIFSNLSSFSSIFHDTRYTSLASWQESTGYDQQTQVLPLNLTTPLIVSQVNAVQEGYVQLSWTPVENQGNEIAHYNIYRNTISDFTPAYSNMVGESTSTSFVDREEVQSNTTYYYKVEAEDRSGNVGIASTTASITTDATIPTDEQPKVVDFMSLRDGYQFNVVDLPTQPYISGIQNIQKVQLYVDQIMIQEMGTSPYAYTVTGLNNGEHSLMYKVYEDSGVATESKQIKINKQVTTLRSAFTQNKPTIDGNLNDWSYSGFKMNQLSQIKNIESTFADQWSPQKLEATGYTQWDEENLYLAVDVTEDAHNLAITDASDLWKGSSIQMAIDPDRGNSPGSKGYTELAFGIRDDGEVLGYRYNAISGKSTGIFDAAEIVVKRNETTKKTIYEIAIPWNEIIPVGVQIRNGSALGISVLANYSDGNFINTDNGDARNGWIEYNSGIGSGKAPIQFGYLLLSMQKYSAPSISGTVSDGSILLNWPSVSGATGYTLKYGTSSNKYSRTIQVGNTTNYTVTGLAAGTTYYFTAEAYDSYGESSLSDEVSFTIISTNNESQNNSTNSNIHTDSTVNTNINTDKYTVEIKDGVTYIRLDTNQTKVNLPLRQIGNYPLQVQLGKVSMTLNKAVLDALKEQAGNFEASLEINMSPIAGEIITTAPKQEENARIKVVGQAYNFSVALITNDKLEYTPKQVPDGVTISLPYDSSTVDEELLGIYIYNETSQQWEYTGGIVDNITKQVHFTLQHPGIYSVLEYQKTFSDFPSGYWAERMLQVLAAKHIVHGVTDSSFNPTGYTTRAEFVTLVVNALQLETTDSNPNFKDISPDAWYANHVSAAVNAGITSGISAHFFAPEQQINRVEMVTLIVRALRIPTKPAATIRYSDSSDIPIWALPYIITASDAELVRGRKNNLFAPQQKATRAEAAQIIYNLLEYMNDLKSDL
ncbi:hypothetical protein J2T12_002917 [Paenibacillus anaericanus]|uniref:S-layer homology domain-containing protein n=1 Tax=Paenibacillus anaericanus TaxID=170367 RepID=UPI00278143F4|nr:S-layer homology domain-containing protein [Paenibacillus anaericanus]MDQ0089505.1 hypothetical protein [Paenibacillus anaericanus]